MNRCVWKGFVYIQKQLQLVRTVGNAVEYIQNKIHKTQGKKKKKVRRKKEEEKPKMNFFLAFFFFWTINTKRKTPQH